MRYSQYKSITELSESLHEALIYIKQTQNLSLINDCIMVLSSIADVLETSAEKEVKKPIKTITEIIDLFEDVQGNIERLIVLSEKLSTECKTELKYKLRILFVAELSSKWDSMKSVYEAMIKRNDCDVDVVLEPIFRATKLPDGTIRSDIIYNPEYLDHLGINHIPYKNYDIEKVQPDITFVSQPYESVTINQFWPEYLSKYTKLVYVPYFTANDLSEVNMDSFFGLPIQKFAWRIICQSEQMKEYYKTYASNKGENVIVTGLPKWDYPIHFSNDSIPMPKEWKPKLVGKPVFLFNSHFSVMPDVIKTYGTKENTILNIFRKDPEIALIWRPHPMSESIIKVYYPELVKEYERIKMDLEATPNIVIDYNDDYRFAFVHSNALLTFTGSLPNQYIFTEKPILFLIAKNDVENLINKSKNDKLFDYSKMNIGTTAFERKEFISRVIKNDSSLLKGQTEVKTEYYPLADGKIGKRVCELIIKDFL